jgi:hypothetical protein
MGTSIILLQTTDKIHNQWIAAWELPSSRYVQVHYKVLIRRAILIFIPYKYCEHLINFKET